MPGAKAFGLPDVALAGADGATVNPSYFAGHDLIVLFCPEDRQAAAKELAAYNALAETLAYNDAYMVAVCDPGAGNPASRISISSDIGRAWAAFSKCLGRDRRVPSKVGTTFLFGRGGCLRQIWHGEGHAQDVAQALNERM